jgi:HSP20 family protein
MTTMTRFVPFRSGLNDVAVLQNRLNSIFNDFARPEVSAETLAAGNFVPAVDVYEDAQKLVLKLEVPGIRREDLEIHVEGRTLSVKGERKRAKRRKRISIASSGVSAALCGALRCRRRWTPSRLRRRRSMGC